MGNESRGAKVYGIQYDGSEEIAVGEDKIVASHRQWFSSGRAQLIALTAMPHVSLAIVWGPMRRMLAGMICFSHTRACCVQSCRVLSLYH